MNGTYSTTLMAAEDANSTIAKGVISEMINTIQQQHTGASILSFAWSQPDVLGQVTYRMEYNSGD